MQTLSFPFRPWRRPESFGSGPAIRDYVRDTARETGVEQHIRFGTAVVSASWSTADARWTVEAVAGEEHQTWTCSVLYLCTGYYDFRHAYQPDFPGVADFGGAVVHPQFWPDDLDVRHKRVVVIGSGATAVTLVPALADAGAEVTMLQRSPSWVVAVGGPDPLRALARRLPERLADRLLRVRNAATTIGFYRLTQRRPAIGRWWLRRGMAAIVGPQVVDSHFTPAYDPWDQRLCVAPEGDFLHAVADGRATVVTDHIGRFEAGGIRLASGGLLEADIVVSATGLQLLALGGATLEVDGRPVDLGQTVAYRGAMLSGVPNFFVCIGYVNAAWTLRAEVTHAFVCRVLDHLDRHGYASVVAHAPPDMPTRPLMALTSGYVRRGDASFPKQGERDPWVIRQDWFADRRSVRRARLEQELEFTRPAVTPVAPVAAERSVS
jgi:cation diffusion facilitator CzcD-associated flavoprotein CzcO